MRIETRPLADTPLFDQPLPLAPVRESLAFDRI
jgi:hypothetical protein